MSGLDAFGAAYERLRETRQGRSWRFEHPDDRRDFEFLASHFADRIEFGLSPRCEPIVNTQALKWCFAQFGEDAVTLTRWSEFRVVEFEGERRRSLGFDASYNPDGQWLLVRRTYLFRDPRHAVLFKLTWW